MATRKVTKKAATTKRGTASNKRKFSNLFTGTEESPTTARSEPDLLTTPEALQAFYEREHEKLWRQYVLDRKSKDTVDDEAYKAFEKADRDLYRKVKLAQAEYAKIYVASLKETPAQAKRSQAAAEKRARSILTALGGSEENERADVTLYSGYADERRQAEIQEQAEYFKRQGAKDPLWKLAYNFLKETGSLAQRVQREQFGPEVRKRLVKLHRAAVKLSQAVENDPRTEA